MPTTGRLILSRTGTTLLEDVRWCDSFGCKLRGLMFRRELPPGEGLLFVENRTSRVDASVHMLFMAFPIAVVWLDEDFRIVDQTLARPWRLAYVPSRPARYTLEANPELLTRVEIGDELYFEKNNH